MKDINLCGKSVLVIGLNDSLSKIIAKMLISDGADVYMIGRDKSVMSENFPNVEDSRIKEFDLTDCNAIEQNIKQYLAADIRYDGVVFCNTHSDFRPLSYVKPDNLTSILNDNYCSFIEFMRVLSKSRKINPKASIVAISSISSIRAMKAKMAFCSSKAALDAAVKCLAVEFANKNIRVNSIQKGEVDVDFEKSHIQDVTSIREDSAEKSHLGVTSANEIANIVSFLLSDATQTLTGQSIVIDGGYTL